MPRNPDVSSGIPSAAHGHGDTAAHEAETNHEMELHPPVLVRTRDGMDGFFQGRTRPLALPWNRAWISVLLRAL